MEVVYQLSKKDYLEAGKLYLKDSLRKRSWVLILFTIIFISVLSGETNTWWRFLITIIVSPLIVIVIFYFTPVLVSSIRLTKAFAKDSSGLEKKKLTVTDDGLLIESESKTQVRKWESIASAHSNDKFINIILVDKKLMSFPKRAFTSESEAINFLGIVQSKIMSIWGLQGFQVPVKNNKPKYSTGIICLIPVVGFIAGIIFIINGIGKYKDRWFVIMGVAGIIWTVVFYKVAFFSNTEHTRKLIVQSAQLQLNALMKDIEFYKLKNGEYPNSLEQITKDDPTAWTDDPIQSDFFDIKRIKFNYQKIGTHYYLFSSGIDGIPNTKDDIYPKIASSDSNKFGLIHK